MVRKRELSRAPGAKPARPKRPPIGGDLNKWAWQIDKPGQVAVSADIIRIFRAEGVEQPGVLARGRPSDQAMLFAREAIQNSWDAARELRAGARPSEFPPFHLEIEFRHFVGEEKRRFVAALGLSEHRAHFGETKQQAFRRKVGLGQSDCLDDLHDLAEPLRVLVYTEHCALGMEGAWDASESRMMFALNRDRKSVV